MTEALRFLVLGCSDAFCSGGRAQTSFLIQSGSFRMLLDCGAQTLSALKAYGISSGSIDAVALTHFHGDHFGGLPFVLLDRAHQGPALPLTIISPPGGRQRIEAALELFYPGTSGSALAGVSFLEYQAGRPLAHGPLELTALQVEHTPETLPHGLRLELGGKTIAYSGDTAWTDALTALSRGADLFVCECNFLETSHQGHMSYRELSSHVHELGSKRLLLTHAGDEVLAHSQDLAFELASVGLELML